MIVGFIALAALGACGDDDGGGSSASADVTDVVSTDTTCKAEKTEFEPGKHTFRVVNEGDKATELYVLGENDKVIGEVENVGPGTSRTLSANLKAGSYNLGCKPGQSGPFIKQPITVR